MVHTTRREATSELLANDTGSETMRHLGHILYMLSDLHPGCRTGAFDDALRFYNGANPGAIIERLGVCFTYTLHCFVDEKPAIYDCFTKEYRPAYPSEIMDELERADALTSSHDALATAPNTVGTQTL